MPSSAAFAPLIWVLDTSVVVKWFFSDEPVRQEALNVRTQIGDYPQRWVVPHLFYTELVHVLVRRSNRDVSFVERALALTLSLGLRTLPLSDQAMKRVVHWCGMGLSGYDATFVALAEDLKGKWITADDRAVACCGGQVAVSLAYFEGEVVDR